MANADAHRSGSWAWIATQTRRPGVRIGAMILAILAAFLLPRAAVLPGIVATSPLRNVDMVNHLKRADLRHHQHGFERTDAHHFAQPSEVRWPPGVFDIAQLWIGRHGTLSIWTTQLTNLIFSIVLIGGVVMLGWAAGGMRVGLWSALLAVLCPALVAHSWYFSVDYPLIGMVTVGLVLLHYTRGFSRWRACLLLCGWSVLGMYFKPTYALYLGLPALFNLISGLRGGAWRRVAVLAGLSLVLTASITIWTQGLELSAVANDLQQHWSPTPDDPTFESVDIEPWSARAFLAYGEFMVANYPLPLLLLALPGLYLLHTRRRGKLPCRGLLLSFLWGTYVVLTAFACKQERYIQVLYPVLCVVTVQSIVTWVPRRWRQTALLWTAAAYAAVLYIAHRHPTPWVTRPATEATWVHHYILPMPGRERLNTLRRRTYFDWQCDIAPLVSQITTLTQRSSGRLVGVWGERLGERYAVMLEHVVLAAQHSAKQRGLDRCLIRLDRRRYEHPEGLPSSLIVLRRADDKGEPSLRIPGRATATQVQQVACGSSVLPLRLTLWQR